jgi:hypothetical protein
MISDENVFMQEKEDMTSKVMASKLDSNYLESL